MINYPSRSEKLEVRLFAAAEKGCFCIKNVPLYPTEIKNLIKKGFSIKYEEYECENFPKNLYFVTISWENAFESGIPLIVMSYITGQIVTYPEKHISNLSKQLYVITKKKNNNL